METFSANCVLNYDKKQAILFSEGNIYLYKLLVYCLKHDIKTNACCAGHYFNTYNDFVDYYMSRPYKISRENFCQYNKEIKHCEPYIGFYIDHNTQNFINYLFESHLLNNENIIINVGCNSGHVTHSHFISFHLKLKEGISKQEFDTQTKDFFCQVHKAVKEYNKDVTYTSKKKELDDFMRNSYVEYQYTFENNKLIKIVLYTWDKELPLNNLKRDDKDIFVFYRNIAKADLESIL